jgi:hypothetical protein
MAAQTVRAAMAPRATLRCSLLRSVTSSFGWERPPGPEWASGATQTLVVDAHFVRAADDPVRHYHRRSAGCVDERQHFLSNSGIVADIGVVGEPAPEGLSG